MYQTVGIYYCWNKWVQVVGPEQRSELLFTRQWRDQESDDGHQSPEWMIEPVYLRQWRCVRAQQRSVHQRVEMCPDQRRRMQVVRPEWRSRGSDHIGVNLYAPDSCSQTRRVQVV
jgi:hypothetical protein